jgi:hypothetical protein
MDQLPSMKEWNLSSMPPARRALLEITPSFYEIVARLCHEATVEPPVVDDAGDQSAPSRTVRVSFNVHVHAEASDIFYNGIAGLRAHYWASPALGDEATGQAITVLTAKLLASIPATSPLRSRKGVVMSVKRVANALELPSAKIWIDERQLQQDGEHLFVARWAENETEPCNPRLWRWTPRATMVQVKTGWLTAKGDEWMPACKQDRARQLYRWGFT